MSEFEPDRVRTPKRCIFCGGGKLTREHLWPEWAAPLLPSGRDPQNYDIAATYHAVTGVASQFRHYRRQGPASSKRLRVVCQPCNSGWMSKLEVAAQPILTPMAQGQPLVLSADMQRTLAAWIAAKTIVAQHNIIVAEVTGESDRAALRQRLEIPAGLWIWLWRCGEFRWRSRYDQHAMTLAAPGGEFDNSGRPNTHDVTFGFGDLLVNALFVRAPGLDLGCAPAEQFSLPLWPPTGRDLSWPPEAIPATGADDVSVALLHAIRGAEAQFVE